MSKFVLIAVGALACGANALYHFHQNLPDPCDVVMIANSRMQNMKIRYFARFHGSFMNMNTTYLSSAPVEKIQLERPDYAEQGKAKYFTWTHAANKECDSTVLETTDIFTFPDLYVTNKEPAVFHGIECTVMYNATDPGETRFYVDESTGTLYGITTKTEEQTYRFIKAFDNKPEKFVFDKKAQPTCDSDAYLPPKQAAYNAACKHTAKSFNALLRSFLKKH